MDKIAPHITKNRAHPTPASRKRCILASQQVKINGALNSCLVVAKNHGSAIAAKQPETPEPLALTVPPGFDSKGVHVRSPGMTLSLLGGSWVVLSRVISPLLWIVT